MTEAVDLKPLDDYLASLPDKTTDVIPILQRAQGIYGYLPRQVLQRVADRVGVSLSKVYGVATFYAQFYLERRGRHILKVCDGTACHVKGAPHLVKAVQQEFDVDPGATSADGLLTAEVVYCVGSCALAPVGMLDGKVMGRLKPDALLTRLKETIGPADAG